MIVLVLVHRGMWLSLYSLHATLALMRFLRASGRVFVGSQCCNHQNGHCSCRILVSLAVGVHRHVYYYIFGSFIVCCAFHLALICLAYRHSAEIELMSVSGVDSWIPDCFVAGLMYESSAVAILSAEGSINSLLGVDEVFAALGVLWAAPSADRCSTSHVVAHMGPPLLHMKPLLNHLYMFIRRRKSGRRR